MPKKQDSDNQRLLFIIGIVSSLTAIGINLTQLFDSKHTKTLLVIVVSSFIIFYLINKLKGRKGVVKILILVIIFISTTSSLFLISLFYSYKLNNETDLFKKGNISIGISRFGDAKGNFSSLVYEFLKEENLSDSIYEIKKIKSDFFEAISDSLFDKKLDSLYLKTGLLISGKRFEEDKLFYCKIKIRNLYTQINKDSIANQLVSFRNPNLHEFSIDNQAQILVDFIVAILSFSQKDFEKSEKLFNSCILNNKNKENTKFLADCHIFLGDIYSIKEEKVQALNSYLESYRLNKSDEVLKSIISIFITQKKYKKAKKYYNKIQNKKEASLDNIKNRLKNLENYYKNLKTSKIKKEAIKIPPRGSFDIRGTDITINYISVTQFDFNNNIFFIYKTDNGLFGIFDSHGRIIKLPEFKEKSRAKIFIQNLMK